ncbi:MAG: phospholipid carrier-dependent glycosyltransferase [Nodosilinea sp.]
MVNGSTAATLRRGLIGLFIAALTLRLWGLGKFSTLVFDEVYYVPFALDYLHQTPSFDAHPPLGKYLIALGIRLGQGPAAWLHWPTIEVAGQALSPLSYRWLNAVTGATLPVLTAALAWQISAAYAPQRRLWFALLAGGLMVVEGLTLVESRLALINIYWLALGLLGQWCWMTAALAPARPGWWRCGAGLALGATISVKWNGAGLWLGLVAWALREKWSSSSSQGRAGPLTPALPWRKLLGYLGLMPLMVYILLWLPHLGLTGEGLSETHLSMIAVHRSIGTGAAVHPYCSAWYTWPLMLRPVAYFHQGIDQGSGLPLIPDLPPLINAEPVVYTLQGMGNPVLWWLASAAVLALALGQGSRWLFSSVRIDRPVATFILINYLANWLPWLLVSRCTFLYHALGMVVSGNLALAWLLSRWWLGKSRLNRALAVALVGAIALAFWFWLPLFLGLPLSPAALQQRWWLPSWI